MFTIHYGLEYEHKQVESLSREKALSYEMSMGTTFMGSAVTKSYADIIRQDTEETFRYNTSIE